MGVLFSESQGFHQNPVALLAAGLVVVVGAGAGLGVAAVRGPAIAGAVAGLVGAIPLTIFALRMRTVVTTEALSVALRPLISRRFALTDIEEVEAVRYSPLRDGGGWGVRVSRGFGLILNVSGDEGVRIVAGGRRYLIGSRRAAELAGAIDAARAAGAGGNP